MNLEDLDCWDDFPMVHGCVCGNDCEPPDWMTEAWSREKATEEFMGQPAMNPRFNHFTKGE